MPMLASAGIVVGVLLEPSGVVRICRRHADLTARRCVEFDRAAQIGSRRIRAR